MDDMEKTEQASERKLKKAREKGQIFKSKDAVDNATLIVGVIAIKFITPCIIREFRLLLNQLLSSNNLNISNTNLLNSFNKGLLFLLKIIIPVFLALIIITLVLNYAQVGFIFSTESLKPDIKKISPVSGFKRIFSKKSLMELLKFLIKIVVIGVVIFNDVNNNLITLNTTIFHNVNFSTSQSFNWMFNILIKIILLLSVFSALDYFLQYKSYMNDMKMSKKEVKDEYKEQEGDPLIKGKLKEKQRQIATSSLIEAASEATVLIANPTHIAICLKYDLSMPVPIVTAIARDHIALKLKEVAKENNVPIVEDRPLARALFNEAEINHPIPPGFYKAITKVLISIMNSKL